MMPDGARARTSSPALELLGTVWKATSLVGDLVPLRLGGAVGASRFSQVGPVLEAETSQGLLSDRLEAINLRGACCLVMM